MNGKICDDFNGSPLVLRLSKDEQSVFQQNLSLGHILL